MSIEFVQPKNRFNVLEEVEARIKRMERDLYLVEKLRDVVKKHDGRKITKRIETDLKKLNAMDLFTIYYVKEHGMYRIIIWGNGINYDDRFSSLLGYESEGGVLSLEKWTEYNQCHFLDEGRIKQLERGKKEIAGLCESWNKALGELQDVHKKAEAFLLQYEFDIQVKR